MSILTKKKIVELVGGDPFSSTGDRNITSNSEIETGPVDKPFNDNSDYEKGVSTTTDRVTSRYRQKIPWFATYSFGGSRLYEKSVTLTKNVVEEKIDDFVKKSKNYELIDKDYNPTFNKIIDTIEDTDLSDDQIEDLEKIISDKKNTINKTKNL